MKRSGTGLILASVLASSAALVACGDASDSGTTPDGTQADHVTASDVWVKATDDDMTAAFGVIANDGTTDATLAGATTEAAGSVEVHEVVMKDGAMVMQPKEGGLVVPAGGSATLEPGGDHLMLMDLTAPIRPGDQVTLTLSFSDGSSLDVTATAKAFTGGNEEYPSSSG